MILNTDLFNKDRKVAVQCQSKHEARVFLDAVITELKYENRYLLTGDEWHVHGSRTTYGFYNGTLLFSSTGVFEELDYQVVDVMSVLLSTKVDEIETDESLSVYNLFGVEVSQ